MSDAKVTSRAGGIGALMCCVCVVVTAGCAGAHDDGAEQPVMAGEAQVRSVDGIARVGRTKVPWSEVVGRNVTAEGIAWGGGKDYGDRRVIMDGETVYIDPELPLNDDDLGKLVSVEGVLHKERIEARAPNTQGSERPFDMYTIKQARWAEIPQVRQPWLEVQLD